MSTTVTQVTAYRTAKWFWLLLRVSRSDVLQALRREDNNRRSLSYHLAVPRVVDDRHCG